jgi:hypothetical protein
MRCGSREAFHDPGAGSKSPLHRAITTLRLRGMRFPFPARFLLFGAMLCAAPRFVSAAPKTVRSSATSASSGNPTAYAALRLIGRELGSENLNQVIEVSGRDGVPQPFLWRITLLSSEARSGEAAGALREVEVAGGRIVARRSISRFQRPGLSSVVAAMNLRDLNLDSSGAFDTANTQGRKIRLSYDALNYTLRADPATGRPAWNVQLLGPEREDLGTLTIAASDGAVVASTGRIGTAGVSGPAEPGPGSSSTSTRTVTFDETDARANGGFLERSGRTLDKTGRQVERSLRKAGATVERFFTGKSDLDKN